MRFNKEDANQLLKEGEAHFQVINAEDKTSKAGSEMIELSIKVWDIDGKPGNIFDYLLPKLAWKIKHFCEATGMIDKFENESLCADDCNGKTGKLFIKTQPAFGQYPEKSVVKDYIKSTEDVKKIEEKPPFDDEIPF